MIQANQQEKVPIYATYNEWATASWRFIERRPLVGHRGGDYTFDDSSRQVSVDRRIVLDLSTYVFERLHEDAEFILSRGRAERADPRSILLLAPVSAHPSLETLKKINHEFSLRPELAVTWAARPFALSRHGEQLVLVRDDPGGELLSRLIRGPMELRQFLRIALGLAAVLRELHQRQLIHKDVKPANILVDPVSGQSWLTGFGIASRLPRQRQAPAPAEFIAGTLAYMAPEQTGRMNRAIDS
ncbi:MAG TPA: protein kinase, partial [Vicinamibacterales bacterium]|nr:protein kinase [Vicinamibacterales bacterium]